MRAIGWPLCRAVCALTALVAFNYILVCRHYPDGGGVYSAARLQSRFLAVLGALLLGEPFTGWVVAGTALVLAGVWLLAKWR